MKCDECQHAEKLQPYLSILLKYKVIDVDEYFTAQDSWTASCQQWCPCEDWMSWEDDLELLEEEDSSTWDFITDE